MKFPTKSPLRGKVLVSSLGVAAVAASTLLGPASAASAAPAKPAAKVAAVKKPSASQLKKEALERKKQAVIAKAYTKMGARYVWGAKGPTTFDCSGLVKWAYREVTGISIADGTSGQIRDRNLKSKSGFVKADKVAKYATYGDLVYMYDSKKKVNHVGFYSGNGKVLNASQSLGSVVDIPMWYFPIRDITWYKVYTWK